MTVQFTENIYKEWHGRCYKIINCMQEASCLFFSFEVIRIRGTTAANLNRINKNTFQMEIFKMEFTTVKHSQCQRVCLTYEQDYT